jgi:polyphosphate kinase
MSQRLLNRELSWLAFNRRVLSLAEEVGIPLLERLKFCAICSSNLDEFFQVRVAALKDQVAAGVTRRRTTDCRRRRSSPRSATTADRFVARQEPCSTTC